MTICKFRKIEANMNPLTKNHTDFKNFKLNQISEFSKSRNCKKFASSNSQLNPNLIYLIFTKCKSLL